MTEHRRDLRFPARIIARVGRRNRMVELLTNDVSFRGVFIRTDAPPALRQLVKVELVLPGKITVSGHAMVVHVSSPPADADKGEGAMPGVGLQFWGPIEHGREWDNYVHELKHRQRTGTQTANATDKIRRASERFKLTLPVVFDGLTLMTRDVSQNGMAIRTETAMPVGMRTELQLRDGNQLLTFDAVVRRVINEPDFRGLGVELVEMSAEKRQELARFIGRNTPSEDRIYVPEGDPKLH